MLNLGGGITLYQSLEYLATDTDSVDRCGYIFNTYLGEEVLWVLKDNGSQWVSLRSSEASFDHLLG